MAATATPLPQTLDVEPGGEAVARVRVRNRSSVVDEFRFAVLGEPEAWTEVDPPSISLFPGGEGQVELRFRPPRSHDTAPGVVPYGLLVDSAQDEDGALVEEGALLLGAYRKSAVSLSPRTSRGRRKGKHTLAVDNFGNTPAVATFTAEDGENAVHFKFDPERLVIPPGTVGFVKVRAKPHWKFLRGPDRVFPFTIHVDVEGHERQDVDGMMIQSSLLPRLFFPILFFLLLLGILWLVFKPEPKLTAKAIAAQQLTRRTNAALTASGAASVRAKVAAAQAKQANQQAKQANQQATKATTAAVVAGSQAQQAGTQAAQADKQAAEATKAAAAAAETAQKAATPAFGGAPSSMRLALSCPPTCSTSVMVPAGQALLVRDLVFQNPGGSYGTLTLALAGKPLLLEPLSGPGDSALHLATPLTVAGGQALALSVACKNGKDPAAPTGPCNPSVLLSGFAPAEPPVAASEDGAPATVHLALTCPSTCSASWTVPAGDLSYDVTDVVFQNPKAGNGTVTLAAAGQPLLQESLAQAGDAPFVFGAPLAFAPGAKLTLSASCKNTKDEGPCTPSVLLVGVAKQPVPEPAPAK